VIVKKPDRFSEPVRFLFVKHNKKYFVSIAGNIGSGKSSLTSQIAGRLGWVPYYESVENNPYLEDFYKDMKRWSFQLQVYFLSHRFKTHKEILNSSSSVVQDRSIYEDVEIFAKNLYMLGRMEKRDYENYRDLFSEMASYIQPPDLIVYLKASVKTLISQIYLRGRIFERSIEEDYIKRLNKSYDEWMGSYKLGKAITVETDKLDFVHNTEDFDCVLKKIKSQLY
jgi:deoxyadenosine/deoxycytidine kinase